jgi:hypothetical protein
LDNGNGGTNALTVSSLSFAGAGTIQAHFGGSTPALAVTNALSTNPANGQIALNISSTVPLPNGTHNIISYGSFGGAASNFTANVISGLNSRQSSSLVLNGNNVALQVVGDTPKWTGAQSSSWTPSVLPAPKNWKLATGGTATDFIPGDNVLFDDTATGSTTVDLDSGDIDAGAIEFNNSSKNYTLTSSVGYFITTGSLTKNGTGSLTIDSQNIYPSGTLFNGGTLNLKNGQAIGTGTFTVGVGSAKTLDNTSGSPVAITPTAAVIGYDMRLGSPVVSFGGRLFTLEEVLRADYDSGESRFTDSQVKQIEKAVEHLK